MLCHLLYHYKSSENSVVEGGSRSWRLPWQVLSGLNHQKHRLVRGFAILDPMDWVANQFCSSYCIRDIHMYYLCSYGFCNIDQSGKVQLGGSWD